MSISGFQAKQRDNTSEFVNVTLPEDSYQCLIEKIDLREGVKFNSTETEYSIITSPLYMVIVSVSGFILRPFIVMVYMVTDCEVFVNSN